MKHLSRAFSCIGYVCSQEYRTLNIEDKRRGENLAGEKTPIIIPCTNTGIRCYATTSYVAPRGAVDAPLPISRDTFFIATLTRIRLSIAFA